MSAIVTRTKEFFSGLIRFTPQNPPEKYGAGYFYPIYKDGSTFNDLQLLNDFREIPEVSAIIRLKAKAFSKMRLMIVSKDTGKEMKNYWDNIKVLRDPNWFQSQKEFLVQTKTFREIYGNEYIYLNYPVGFSPLSSKAMYTLPPNLMTTKTPNKQPFFMQIDPEIEYYFQWGADKYQVPKENIIHLNDNRVEMTKQNWVEGESWLAYQRAPVNNIRAAYHARGFLIENRGAMGILSNAAKDTAGAIPMDVKEKSDLREQLSAYGRDVGKVPWIITNLALEWKQISIDNPQNLGLFEEVKQDFYKLCDAAGVDPILFGGENGTFENQKWAERRMYENTTIPEAEEWIGALNSGLETDKKGWTIVGTYEHLNVFQENLKERGDALNRMGSGLTRFLQDGAIDIEGYREELRRAGLVIGS